MATQAGINQHDALIERIVKSFARGISPFYDEIFANLANNPNPNRAAILTLFFPLKQWIREQAGQLDTIANSNREMNSDVLDNPLSQAELTVIQTLKAETAAAVLNQVENEQQSIIQALAIAAVAGAALPTVLRDLRSLIGRSIKRISDTFRTLVRNFDGAFTLVRAAIDPTLKFRYVGGVIQTSRGFCRSHNNKVYTRKEIETIWRSQTWGGKAPGNPFIVRGGYNCRHLFVPVRENQNASA